MNERALRSADRASEPTLQGHGFLLLRRALGPLPSISAFIALSAILFLAVPQLFRNAFPVLAFVTAANLYRQSAGHYVSFVWWLYFVSALVRRLVDYRTDFVEPNAVLLAPVLAAFICCPGALRRIRLADKTSFAFLFPLFAVLYSFSIAYARGGVNSIAVVKDLLSWTVPIGFGLYLYQHWSEHERLRDKLQRTFAWGMLLMGSYAVVQVLTAPPWDAFWIENAGVSSIGNPEPLGFRAFSTMNSQQPLALTCVIGLLFIVRCRGWFYKSASIAGYLAVILSMSRGAWLLWLTAILAFGLIDRSRTFASTAIFTIFAIAAAGCAMYLSPVGEQIFGRLHSFEAIQQDESAEARFEGYREWLSKGMLQPFGGGFGTADAYDAGRQDDTQIGPHDSMAIELLMTSGWFGVLVYTAGSLGAACYLLRAALSVRDEMVSITAALLVGLVVHGLLDSLTGGAHGLALWTCIGSGLGAVKHRAGHPSKESLPTPGNHFTSLKCAFFTF